MNGILVVDKPQGFTSFDVVAKLRGICKMKKIGHGGTLDPMATGVLPVFLGTATRAMDLQPRQDKCYEAALLLGLQTDTGDITGEVLRRAPVTVGEKELLAVLPRFLGAQSQLPPMYSAVKINGKPLYRYAREGKEVERKPRSITIHSLDYLGPGPGKHEYRLRVHCAKGTYIRTLCEDVGTALSLPAALAALRRTAAGVYTAEQAHTLEEIQAAADARRLEALLHPVEELFAEYPALALTPAQKERLLNGAPLWDISAAPGMYRACQGNAFLGLVRPDGEGALRLVRLFCTRD